VDRLVAGEVVVSTKVVTQRSETAGLCEVAPEPRVCTEADRVLDEQVGLTSLVAVAAAQHGGEQRVQGGQVRELDDAADVRPIGDVVDVVGDELLGLGERPAADASWGEVTRAIRPGVPEALPLFHSNALLYSVLGSLAAGASLVLLPRFSATTFWEQARRYVPRSSTQLAQSSRS
jgi:acyl-CoA synthetase (AMP-forming)/AMP-acid ligase II